MGNVSVKNERFSKYLMYKLNKSKIEVDDLYTITEMTLNKNDFRNEVTDFEIDGIRYFKGLNKLYIKNFKITSKLMREIASIKNLKKIVFFSCDFEKSIKINNKLDELQILNCTNICNIKTVNTSYIKLSNVDIDFNVLKILSNSSSIVLFNTFIGFDLGNNDSKYKNKKVVIKLKKSKDIKIIDSKINDNILFKFKVLENISYINTPINEELKVYIDKNDKNKKINTILKDKYIEFTKEKGDVNV